MTWLEALSYAHLSAFVLVLARVGGLALSVPVLGAHEVPVQVRAWLVVALSLLLAPTQWAAAAAPPATLVEFAAALLGELLLGFALGWGVAAVFSGIQLAGTVLGQVSGMSLADVFQPGFDSGVPLLSQALYLFALALFVLLRGPVLVVEGLLQTFAVFPLGGAASLPVAESAVAWIGMSFALAVRAAAPALTALILATLVLGMISRTLPQLNLMALGFGVNVFVTLGMLSLALGGAAWLFQDELEAALAGLASLAPGP
jgi:flagellar biosynthetic protein FliR